MTIYNCECDAAYPKETLLALRTKLMRRLGFSAQVANPPPGMAALLDTFLQDAQRSLFATYSFFRTRRWYTWTLVPGERFYDYETGDDPDNPCPTKVLDPENIKWVGISRNGSGWTPLTRGISPEMYSSAAMVNGFPQRYELGQCIELWPTPVQADLLRVYGDFGLLAFAADGDFTTIDPLAIFYYALGNAKAHYRQPDWQNYIGQAENRVMSLVAATHAGNRYIPADMPGCRWEGLNGVSGPAGIRFVTGGDVRTIY